MGCQNFSDFKIYERIIITLVREGFMYIIKQKCPEVYKLYFCKKCDFTYTQSSEILLSTEILTYFCPSNQ